MLFLFFAALWFILRSASCFKVFPCSLSSCFVIPLRIVITSLAEEEDGLCASRAFVCLFCTCWFLSFFSSCSCRGLAAFCDCGTPWTFLLTFLPTLVLYYEPGHEKMCLMSYANNKGADQPAHPRSLISAFVVRCLYSIISLDSIAEISKL